MVTYVRGLDYPRAGFVQKAVERHFKDEGCHIIDGGYSDLVCTCAETGGKWVVEALGETTSTGSDFRTGLGQLLQRMDEPRVNYAVAVPQTHRFIKQCEQIADWVRAALNLYLIFVDARGRVTVTGPREDLI